MEALKKMFLCFLVVCLSFFNGCGLETVYYLVAPSVPHQTPSVSTVTDFSNYDLSYFEFSTKDAENSSMNSGGFVYLGTGIYYKIYYNISTMLSANSSLDAADESNAATKLINTYNYKPLRLETSAPTPLIPASSRNQRVYIRLSNYKESETDAFKAVLKIDDVEKGIPRRVVGSNNKYYSFDFGRNDDSSFDIDVNKVPVRGKSSTDVDADEDVEKDDNNFSDENEKLWFVDMYAVSEGRDDTYTIYYSDVYHLGAVCINAGSIDN